MPLSFLSLSQKQDLERHTVPIGFTGLASRLGPHAGYTNRDLLLDPHALPVDRPSRASRHHPAWRAPHRAPLRAGASTAGGQAAWEAPGGGSRPAVGSGGSDASLFYQVTYRVRAGMCVGLPRRAPAAQKPGLQLRGSGFCGEQKRQAWQCQGAWPRVSEDAETTQKAEGTPFKKGQAGLGNPEHGTRESTHFLYMRRRGVRELLLRVPALRGRAQGGHEGGRIGWVSCCSWPVHSRAAET